MATLLRVKPVSTSGSQAVSLLVEYEVTAGACGEAFYPWDNYGFGNKLIGTAL